MYWLPSIATGLKRLESVQTWNLLDTRIEARGFGATLTRNVPGYSSSRLSGMGGIRDFGITYKEFKTQYQ